MTPEMMLPEWYTVFCMVFVTELDRLDFSLLKMSMTAF
jgi:hypothetical protein